MSRPRTQKFETLILAALLRAKSKYPDEVLTLQTIYKTAGGLQELENLLEDVKCTEIKIRNNMGRIAEFAAEEGYMILTVRRPQFWEPDKSGHKIEGWKIVDGENEEDKILVDKEWEYLQTRAKGFDNGADRFRLRAIETKVLNP